MDILDILKQRLTPIYPKLQGQFAPMPDTHSLIVNRQAANGGSDGSVLNSAMGALGANPSNAQAGSLLGSDVKSDPANDQHLAGVAQQRPNDGLAGGLSQAGAMAIGGAMGAGSQGKVGVPATPVIGEEVRPDGLAGGLMGSGVTPDPLHGNAGAMEKYGPPAAPQPQPQPQTAIQPDIPVSTAQRQRVVPNQPITQNLPGSMPAAGQQPAAPQPSIVQPLTRRQKIEADIAEIEGRDYTPATYRNPQTGETSKKAKPGFVLEKEAGSNYDKTHNILDVLRGAGLGALQGAKMGGGLAGILAGAGAGAIAGGVDRNADNKMMDEFKLSGLQADLARQNEYEIGGFKRDKAEADAAEAQAKPARENAKAVAEINEKQAKMRIDALKETLGLKYYDPKRPDHRAIAQQAGIDPDSMPAYDDRGLVERSLEDGTKIRISGSDAWKEEQTTARGQVAREQDITKFNANNQLEVDKKNVDNEMKWRDDIRQTMTKIAEANADLVGGSAEAQTANSRVQKAHADILAAQETGDADALKAATADFDKAAADFGKAIGKTQGGATLASELKKVTQKRPPKITYTPVKAASTGKRVAKGKDPLGLFR